MPLERSQVFSRIGVPQTDGIVPTSTSKRVAVWTERNATYRSRMPLERSQVFARVRIPFTDGVISTPAGDSASIRTERNAVNARPMAL